MLWFGIPTIIFIGAPHALHTLTSIPAPEGIKAAPLNTRLSLFAGRSSVQHKPLPLPAPGFGSSRPSASTSALAGSTLRTLCAVTLSRYPLFDGRPPRDSTPSNRACTQGHKGGPVRFVRGLGTSAASLAMKSSGARPPRSNNTCRIAAQ